MQELEIIDIKYQVKYTNISGKTVIIQIICESLANDIWYVHGKILYSEISGITVGKDWSKPKLEMTCSRYQFSKKGFI